MALAIVERVLETALDSAFVFAVREAVLDEFDVPRRLPKPAPERFANRTLPLTSTPQDSIARLAVEELGDSVSVGAVAGGACLFHQGDPQEFVYFLATGTLRLVRIISDGRRAVLGFPGPGDIINLSPEANYTYGAEALGAVEVYRIPRHSYLRVVDSNPLLMRRMLSQAAIDLTIANERAIQLARLTAREKTASFLLAMRERWMNVSRQEFYVPLPMTRQDIADFLGVTNETVSRMFSQLVQQRLISIAPGGIRVLDLARLRVAACP